MAGSIESETGRSLLRREDCPKELFQILNLRWISRVREITMAPKSASINKQNPGPWKLTGKTGI